MSNLNPEFKTKWLTALRSGEYQQCRSDLKNHTGFCCLGVLADLENPEWVPAFGYGRLVPFKDGVCLAAHSSSGQLSSNFGRKVGLSYDGAMALIGMNDGGDSFVKIADYIEEHL